MTRLAELAGRDLRWVQPRALKMRYELRLRDERLATLAFRSSFGTLATGEGADGCWTFKRVGFLRTRVTIRVCGEEADLAVFRHNTWSGGGEVELTDRRVLRARTNLWQSRLTFETEGGPPLLTFRTSGVLRLSATVTLDQRTRTMRDLPWLTMLGWYLIVMMHLDSAGAGAVG